MIDKNYATYKQPGFVISTKCANPTIETGYQYYKQTTIYKKIRAMGNGEEK